jgi:hypothetical protein
MALNALDEKIRKLRGPGSKLSKAKENLEEKESDYGKGHAALQDALDAVNLQIDQVAQKIDLLESKPKPHDSHTSNQVATLKEEVGQLYRQHQEIVAIAILVKAYDKEYAGLKNLLDKREKRFGDIIAFLGNNALMQFKFQVTENNNATSRGMVTWPIDIGIITLGYAVGDKRIRESDRQVKLIASFGELIKLANPYRPVKRDVSSCDDVEVAETPRFPLRYPITGEIGLSEVISDYMKVTALKGGKFEAGSSSDSYRDKISFTTTINGGINPGVNLNKRMGQLIEANLDLNADRKDVHELMIFLTPAGAPKASSAQEVVIREMPAIRVRARSVEQSPAGM